VIINHWITSESHCDDNTCVGVFVSPHKDNQCEGNTGLSLDASVIKVDQSNAKAMLSLQHVQLLQYASPHLTERYDLVPLLILCQLVIYILGQLGDDFCVCLGLELKALSYQRLLENLQEQSAKQVS
jgi:hypothetical protein